MTQITLERVSAVLAGLEEKHRGEMLALGRDPDKYASGYSVAIELIRDLVRERDGLNRALWVSCGGTLPASKGQEICIAGTEPADEIEVSPWGDYTRYRRKFHDEGERQ